MKDRRENTYKILVGACERKITALEAQLASLRFEYAELQQATGERKETLAKQMQEESERNAHMQSMTSGRAIKVNELYQLRQYQDIVTERRVQFEAQCAQAQQAELAKQNEIQNMQRQIAKNQAQRDEYKKLLEKIKSKALKAAEDAQDEAAEEAIVAQRRLQR